MKNIIWVILLFLCVSCATTKYIEVPIETIKTEYINQYFKDSVYIHDSINRYVQGDTVYQYKYKYIYKYLNHTDTVIKVDSIPYIVKEETIKEVNVIKWYQSVLMYIGFGTILVLLYIIITWIRKRFII